MPYVPFCLSLATPVAIRPAFSVSSNHPSPEALRIEKSYVVSSHPRSYGLIRLSDKLLPTSLPRLYGRSWAFQDSSCLSIRLSPLYLHISHRLPPSIRREVYRVLSPISSPIPSAIAKSTSAWHFQLYPLQSASRGGVLRRCNVRFTLRPPVLLSSCADLNFPFHRESPTSFLLPSLLRICHLLLSRISLPR